MNLAEVQSPAAARPALLPRVFARRVQVDGLTIFYRETLPTSGPSAPTLLLLHGFPSGSHQFRRLIDALGLHYRIIAPDFPGFGHSEAPPPASRGGSFAYTFDHLADVMERFWQHLGLQKAVFYVFDYGAPIGLRLAERHPDWVAGLIVQNGNAYAEGLSPTAQGFVQLRAGDPGVHGQLLGLLSPAGTRSQYETGLGEPATVPDDGWLLDQAFLEQPGRKDIQIELALDYHRNVEAYPRWQAWLRRLQPPLLVVWGQNDPFFTVAGARAYARDVPGAEIHLFNTGHFALEEAGPEIASLVHRFLQRIEQL